MTVLLLKLRFFVLGCFGSQDLSGARAQVIREALDTVLRELLDRHAPAGVDLNSAAAAHVAIKANTTHCGPIARRIEQLLRQKGVRGIQFHSLLGHYLIRDAITGLLYDLECYGGVRDKEALPLYRRASGNTDRAAVDGWLVQRRVAFAGLVTPGANAQ